MRKVVAFIGTQTKKHTHQAVQEFEKHLKQQGAIDFEYVFLSDYKLEFCRGCKICFDRGEDLCPLRDDRDILVRKLDDADGVVFATPNYAFQLSARLKNFFDRTAYFYHRPRYFGRICTAIVTQGIFGGGKVAKYLRSTGENMGFRASKGCCIKTLEPMTEAQQRALVEKARGAAARFYRELLRPAPAPSLIRLMFFRIARASIKGIDQKYRDYQHYRENGWFESDYYHPTSLGLPKKLAGKLFDCLGRTILKI